MKKLSAIFFTLFLCLSFQLQATKPIPSYSALISRTATFTKKHRDIDLKSEPKGRRYMMVVSQVAGPSKDPVFVWVYSLDGRDILGPYCITGNGGLSVSVDNRLWDVRVQCTDKKIVSVWTDPPTN